MFFPAPIARTAFSPNQPGPCPAFPIAVRFTDVEPEVLAREAANETRGAGWPEAGTWHTYLHRVMPALERSAAGEMAHALLGAGTGAVASHSHADRMRRQAIAAGAVHRARFWADVAEQIVAGRRS